MDAFLIACRDLAVILLPTVGVLALVYIIMVCYQMIKLLKQIQNSTKDIDKTVYLVNDSLKKVQAPLNTAQEISHTIDSIHQSGIIAFKKASDYAINNLQVFKEYINNHKKEEKND